MAFLRKLFRQTKQVDDWYFLNVDEAADKMDEDSGRIVKALGHLAEVGDIALQGTTVRLRYTVGADSENTDELAQKLVDRYRAREKEELARIHAVVDLVEQDKCIMERLAKFFGEIPKPCGECTVCRDKFRGPMPKIEYPFPAEKYEGAVRRLRSENRSALAGTHQFTRFLCGVPSPAVVRVDLQNHELFGAFKEAPFQRVAGYVEECTKAPF